MKSPSEGLLIPSSRTVSGSDFGPGVNMDLKWNSCSVQLISASDQPARKKMYHFITDYKRKTDVTTDPSNMSNFLIDRFGVVWAILGSVVTSVLLV